MKEKQKRYEAKLREQGIKRSVHYQVKCHKEHDKDIIDFMDKLPNKSGFLKELIREHIRGIK